MSVCVCSGVGEFSFKCAELIEEQELHYVQRAGLACLAVNPVPRAQLQFQYY